MDKFQIRKDPAAHLAGLKAWLKETEDQPLEEMSDFFTIRLDDYERHMKTWQDAYRALPDFFPFAMRDLLDLGCGTGLELESLFPVFPDLRVTAVDLCVPMLERLEDRFTSVCTLRGDYFAMDYPPEAFDGVLSFQSLHHFSPDKKAGLYARLYRTLRPGGVFVLADYLACCPEEEKLMAGALKRRRAAQNIPPERLVHFDIPLTPEREIALLEGAGFSVSFAGSFAGTSILTARRPRDGEGG